MTRRQRHRAQQGVALLEAMIAIIILGIGLLGTIGLQARAYSSINDAGARAEATIASQKIIGIMSTDVTNLPAYVTASCAAPPTLLATWCNDTTVKAIPGATASIAVTAAGGGSTAVTVTISWIRKAGDPVNVSTMTSYLAGSS